MRLTEFVKEMCEKCSCVDLQYIPDCSNLDDFGDAMMICAMCVLCPIANTYFALVGCAELRERLRMYEDGTIHNQPAGGTSDEKKEKNRK